jgi:hypothetical protein
VKYGFTGSRFMHPKHFGFVRHVLDELGPGTEWTTGGAPGVDLFVLRYIAETRPDVFQRLIVAGPDRSDSNPKRWALIEKYMPLATEVIILPKGTDYRFRNGVILDHTEFLVALPLHPESSSPRSGTWMTIRMAREREIPMWVGQLQSLGG